jgi:ribosomal protein L40E
MGFLIYMNCKKLNELVIKGQYLEVKSKIMIWMIFGLIFVFVLPGLLLMFVYIKLDELMKPSTLVLTPIVMVQQPTVQGQVLVIQQPVTTAPPVPPTQAATASKPDAQTTTPAKTDSIFCVSCGTQCPKNAAFCYKCGTKLIQ